MARSMPLVIMSLFSANRVTAMVSKKLRSPLRRACMGSAPHNIVSLLGLRGTVPRSRVLLFQAGKAVTNVVSRNPQQPRRRGYVMASLLQGVLNQTIDGLFELKALRRK